MEGDGGVQTVGGGGSIAAPRGGGFMTSWGVATSHHACGCGWWPVASWTLDR